MFRLITKIAGFMGYFIQYGCWTHCTFEYIGDFVICSGPSMEPTIYSNNILITERITPRFNIIHRGDIIIAKCPTNPSQHICKRVVALPGDRIQIKPSININPFRNTQLIKSVVEIDDINITPKSLKQTETITAKSSDKNCIDYDYHENQNHNLTLSEKIFKSNVIIVPRGHIWIEGDNTENSSDSRSFGPIPQGLIRSRAICRLWPINDMKLFSKRNV